FVGGCVRNWTMAEFRKTKIEEIRAHVGSGRVTCGLAGGVDSAVAAVLIHEAIGDHGLMRMGDGRSPHLRQRLRAARGDGVTGADGERGCKVFGPRPNY